MLNQFLMLVDAIVHSHWLMPVVFYGGVVSAIFFLAYVACITWITFGFKNQER